MSSQKLAVYSIKIGGDITWFSIITNLLARSSRSERCIINEQSNSYIGGYFLLETVHNQMEYNIEDNCFEMIPVKRLGIMKFDVFTSNQTLLLWGGSRVSSAFLTAVERAGEHNITLDYKKSDFKKMVEYLIKNPLVTFVRMRIKDVLIDQGIIANCSVNLKGQENANRLVKKYLNNISQISVLIGSNHSPVSLSIYSSGSVVVYKDRDDIPEEAMSAISEMLGGVM